MKNFLLLICFSILTLSLQAQDESQDREKYMQAMSKLIEKLDVAESVEEYQNLSNAFERIAQAEQGEWLPWYYSGFSQIMMAFAIEDLSKVDEVVDYAEKHIALAEQIAGDNADIFVLKSMVAGARIRVDFSRGMQYGPAASGFATRATTLEEGNPRGWLQLGQQTLYTPEAFGGGPGRGCALLKKARDRFESFEPASPIHPNWGEEYLNSVIAQSCSGYIK